MHSVSKVRNNGTGTKALKIVSNVDGLLYNAAVVYIELIFREISLPFL